MINLLATIGILSNLWLPQPEKYIEQPKTVQELVTIYADEFGVDQKLAHYIAKNESNYDASQIGDMGITCPQRQSPFYGQPVRARGVFQITQCWYPHVSDKEAFDAETNIKIAMEIIAKGEKICRQQFSTCNKYYRNL